MPNHNLEPQPELIAFSISDTKNDPPKLPVQRALQPEYFNATSKTVDEWLELFEIVALANNWQEPDKVAKAPAYLVDAPLRWYISYSKTDEGKSPSWANFTAALKKNFRRGVSKSALFDKMINRTLAIGEPFEAYFNDKVDFCKRYDPDMKEAEVVHHVQQGLLPTLFEKIYPKSIKTLAEMHEECQLLLEGSEIANQRRHANLNMVMNSNSYLPPPQRRPQQHLPPSAPRMSRPTCFICGRPDHFVRDCRSQPRKYNNDRFSFRRGPPRGRGGQGGRGRSGYSNRNFNSGN